MNKKYIIYVICALYLLFIYGCAKQETKEPSITIEAEAHAVLTEKQSECNQLGEQIIKECMNVNPNCFKLKEQWDLRRCSE